MEILIILFKLFIQMHLNPLKGFFRDKLLIIEELLSFQFAEILNFKDAWPQKVLNFSHVCWYDFKVLRYKYLSNLPHDPEAGR